MKNFSMRNFVFLAGVVVFSSLATLVLARDFLFSDHQEIPKWAEDAVYELNEAGVIQGYADGTFGPNRDITRAEVAVLLVRYEDYLVEKYGLEIVEIDDLELGVGSEEEEEPSDSNDLGGSSVDNGEDNSEVLGAGTETFQKIEFLAEDIHVFNEEIKNCQNEMDYYFDEEYLDPPEKNSDFEPIADLFSGLKSSDYEVCLITEDKYLFLPGETGTGMPIVALNTGEANNFIAEIPHPFFEDLTLEEGLIAFEDFDARAVIVSGVHRCASGGYSTCDGKTSACDGESTSYRDSDPAHNDKTLFHEFHLRLTEQYPEALVVNFHGMGSDGLSISNGTKLDVDQNDPVGRIYREFVDIFPEEEITTCNQIDGFEGEVVEERHCGTTNVQGRDLNGSANVCEDSADFASQKFIHLEQSKDLREEKMEEILTAIVKSL